MRFFGIKFSKKYYNFSINLKHFTSSSLLSSSKTSILFVKTHIVSSPPILQKLYSLTGPAKTEDWPQLVNTNLCEFVQYTHCQVLPFILDKCLFVFGLYIVIVVQNLYFSFSHKRDFCDSN